MERAAKDIYGEASLFLDKLPGVDFFLDAEATSADGAEETAVIFLNAYSMSTTVLKQSFCTP